MKLRSRTNGVARMTNAERVAVSIYVISLTIYHHRLFPEFCALNFFVIISRRQREIVLTEKASVWLSTTRLRFLELNDLRVGSNFHEVWPEIPIKPAKTLFPNDFDKAVHCSRVYGQALRCANHGLVL